MRTHKKAGSVNTEYYHDGQISPDPGSSGPMEDAVLNSGTYTVTRYGLGARGLDYMQQGTATSRPLTTYSTVVFPLYDAHGNMIATLARSGSGSFTLGNQRSFDAWGAVRQGAATGAPIQRYCANLGHQQDDESGLIYMRARYYEPVSGRFISEDPERNGGNWYVYCAGNPTCLADRTGQDPDTAEDLMDLIKQLFGQAMGIATSASKVQSMGPQQIMTALSVMAQIVSRIEGLIGFAENSMNALLLLGGAAAGPEAADAEEGGAGLYGAAKILGLNAIDQLTDEMELLADSLD